MYSQIKGVLRFVLFFKRRGMNIFFLTKGRLGNRVQKTFSHNPDIGNNRWLLTLWIIKNCDCHT